MIESSSLENGLDIRPQDLFVKIEGLEEQLYTHSWPLSKDCRIKHDMRYSC